MFNINSRKDKKEKGQGLVEYALILVLVAIVVIVVLMFLGGRIGILYARVLTGVNANTCPAGQYAIAAKSDTIKKWESDGLITIQSSQGNYEGDPDFLLACVSNK